MHERGGQTEEGRGGNRRRRKGHKEAEPLVQNSTMPAKGWRKDEQESNFDTVLLNENLSIDSFLFPKATINKICKQALQSASGVGSGSADSGGSFLLAKDTQTVIQRSSILFVNFIYHHAKQIVKLQNRKVVNADDIINALVQVGYGEFAPILSDELQRFNAKKEAKKLARAKLKSDAKKSTDLEDADLDDDGDSAADRVKKIKLDNPAPDDTMSDADSSVHNASTSGPPAGASHPVPDDDHSIDDLEEDEHSAGGDVDEDAEDDEDDEADEADEADDNEIRQHAPSQLELEARELEGDIADRQVAPNHIGNDDDDDDEDSNDDEHGD